MNRIHARRKAQVEATTVGELRQLIEAKPGAGMSRVNAVVPLAKAKEIYLAALKLRGESEIVGGGKGRTPTRDVLLLTNIYRDCA